MYYSGLLLILLALILGGGTQSGFLPDVILQTVAIPVLILALWHALRKSPGPHAKWALIFCFALFLVPILQLIPLPPSLWTMLPGHAEIVAVIKLTGQSLPWLPLSVSPQATWLSMASLLPPVAVFLVTLNLGYHARRQISLLAISFGLASVFIGLLQVAQGPSSSLRFYEITNPSEAVGFFANRNHYAAMLYSLLALALAWTVSEISALFARPAGQRHDMASTLKLALLFVTVILFVSAQIFARSRAGIGLTIIALFGGYILSLSYTKRLVNRKIVKLALGATILIVIFLSQSALYRMMARFDTGLIGDGRSAFAASTIVAAREFMPFGSGVGTFVPVYAMFEKTEHLLSVYVNRAHNDWLEIWLETGVFGLLLLAMFMVIFGARALQLWRRQGDRGEAVDLTLARAASLLIVLVMIHSLADYPLRTAAMMAIFAFACALLFEPPAKAVAAKDVGLSGSLSEAFGVTGGRDAAQINPALKGTPPPPPPSIPPQPPGQAQWVENLQWPAEWGGSKKPPSTTKARKGKE